MRDIEPRMNQECHFSAHGTGMALVECIYTDKPLSRANPDPAVEPSKDQVAMYLSTYIYTLFLPGNR